MLNSSYTYYSCHIYVLSLPSCQHTDADCAGSVVASQQSFKCNFLDKENVRRLKMKYMGGKTRIAKHIVPIMLAHRKPGMAWVEPFVGGGNVIDKVDGVRIGGDANKWAILALRSIRDNVHLLPKNNLEFTEEDYKRLRISDDYEFKGYAGFAFSYGAKWLGGWSRSNSNRDYVSEAYRNALKQHEKLQGVDLVISSYEELVIPDNSLIYCDPPYANTTGYMCGIDHDSFWQWCRDRHGNGHAVFVSEYCAPDDFECVWSGVVASSLTKNTGAIVAQEKLFTLRRN